LENLGLNLGFLIQYALAFAVLFVVLRAWVYQPVLGLLEKRRNTIAQGLEDARVAAEARANAEREANRIISEAQSRAQQIIHDAEQRAQEVAREIRAAAEDEAVEIRENALADLDDERRKILTDLRGQVVSLAMAAAEKLIGESLDERRQRLILDEFFSGVREGRVTVLNGTAMRGQTAEVTSALALSQEEQEAIRAQLQRDSDGPSDISFRVDPSIIGGLIIRVGDNIVDASIANRLQELRESLV